MIKTVKLSAALKSLTLAAAAGALAVSFMGDWSAAPALEGASEAPVRTAILTRAPDEKPDVADHYLILQGENYFQLAGAWATPNVTFFALSEAGAIPVSPFGPTSFDENCPTEGDIGAVFRDGGGTGTGEGSVSGGIVSAPAVPKSGVSSGTDSAVIIENDPRISKSDCPIRDLGELWDAGSEAFDGDGNSLGSQVFDMPAPLFRVRSTQGDERLAILQGGEGRRGDPAIRILGYENAILADYPIRKGGPVPLLGPSGAGKVSLMKDLPGLFPGEDRDIDPDDFLRVPEETLNRKLEEALRAAGLDGPEPRDVIMVQRWGSEEERRQAEERLERLGKIVTMTVGPRVNVSAVSFGNLSPICDEDDYNEMCWSLNRSLIIYVSP